MRRRVSSSARRPPPKPIRIRYEHVRSERRARSTHLTPSSASQASPVPSPPSQQHPRQASTRQAPLHMPRQKAGPTASRRRVSQRAVRRQTRAVRDVRRAARSRVASKLRGRVHPLLSGVCVRGGAVPGARVQNQMTKKAVGVS
jgi:hypothetical protein